MQPDEAPAASSMETQAALRRKMKERKRLLVVRRATPERDDAAAERRRPSSPPSPPKRAAPAVVARSPPAREVKSPVKNISSVKLNRQLAIGKSVDRVLRARSPEPERGDGTAPTLGEAWMMRDGAAGAAAARIVAAGEPGAVPGAGSPQPRGLRRLSDAAGSAAAAAATTAHAAATTAGSAVSAVATSLAKGAASAAGCPLFSETVIRRVEMLREVPLFSGIPTEQMVYFAENCEGRVVGEGEEVITEVGGSPTLSHTLPL